MKRKPRAGAARNRIEVRKANNYVLTVHYGHHDDHGAHLFLHKNWDPTKMALSKGKE